MPSFLKKILTLRSKTPPKAALREAVTDAIMPLLLRDKSVGKITPLVQINDNNIAMISLEIDPQHASVLEPLRKEVAHIAERTAGIDGAQVVLTAQTQATPKISAAQTAAPAKTQPASGAQHSLPHVKNVILVSSGKGGVGKSTVTANLAHALAQAGKAVGVMDADIYGPSQPRMFGIEGQKPDGSQGHITPIRAHGIDVMSIGLMVDPNAALIWRGPIVQKALMQLLFDVQWGRSDAPLDYLLIDMPPGTGDVQLTLAQKVHIDGAIIVSTPQDIALIDARRGVAMFEKTNIPILGIIENMSTHICSNCGHEEHIFGHGGARSEAEKMHVPFLGDIPLSAQIRADSDQGVPAQVSEPYQAIARHILDRQ